ncbi:MAG: PD-(D/E)XK nuclease family protein [Myxococcota bacterium]
MQRQVHTDRLGPSVPATASSATPPRGSTAPSPSPPSTPTSSAPRATGTSTCCGSGRPIRPRPSSSRGAAASRCTASSSGSCGTRGCGRPPPRPAAARARLHEVASQVLDEIEAGGGFDPLFQAYARSRWLAGLVDDRPAGILRSWLDREQREPTGVPEAVEQPFDGLAVGPLRVRGVIDQVDRLPNGARLVTDYKTGAPPTREQLATGLAFQPVAYAAWVAGHTGAAVAASLSLSRPDAIRRSALAGHPDALQAVGDTSTRPLVLDDDARDALMARAGAAAEQLVRGAFSPTSHPPALAGRRCPYRRICRLDPVRHGPGLAPEDGREARRPRRGHPPRPGLARPDRRAAARAGHRPRVRGHRGRRRGKTHTLALRFVSLLVRLADDGVDDVGRVLVLTFTDKAAQEMAERCRRTLGALIEAARDAALLPPADERLPALVARLERMEERFDQARIGTFHSFCASILREFPARTSTPPGAAPLPAGESRRWLDEALEDALDAHLAARPADLPPLLDAFGRRQWLLDAGRTALSRLGLLQDVLERHAAGRVRLQDVLDAATPRPEAARDWVAKVGLPSLKLLQRLCAPSGGGTALPRCVAPLAGAEPGDDPLRVYARYREVLGALLTDAGTVRQLDHHTVLGTKDRWPDERRYRQAKEAARALQARLGDWGARADAAAALPTPADRVLLAALEPFAQWVLAAAGRLGRALDRHRRLTFEEMQRRAVRAVLADPDLRATLRDRFRSLMVDEFQDTDAQQWSLVLALARRDPAVPEDRLFLVGDPKQAIYGFRGGDVAVFQQAVERLGVAPVVLADNFRSRPGLIAWFNALFPGVLQGVPYDPMIAQRGEQAGEVAVVQVADDDQAGAVARWIAGALRGADGQALREAAVPPIAVLLRSRTRQPRYEAALRAVGVPYVVVGGVGFWSRPEVLDAVNLVCAVAQADPVSLVGALRSPLGGLRDADIQRIALPEAARRLGYWQRRRHEVPPSQLVREIGDALAPTLALQEGLAPGRAAANVDRLAAWVAPLDELGLAGVADRLLAEVALEAREAEASLVPSEARVVICTVHAAKGLEFPVVVVPEMGARPRSDLPALLVSRLPGDPHGSFHLASRVLDPDADVETRVRPGRYTALADALRRDQDAEARRLLYVACTRARDRLVLVGPEQPPAEPGARATWMQLVDAGMPRGTPRLGSVPAAPPLPAPPPPAPPGAPLPAVPTVRALELPASALDRLVACPARWYRRDRLGLPEAPASARDRHLALAAARGQVVHQVLQDGVHGDERAVWRRWAAAARALGADDEAIDAGMVRLREHLAATAASPGVQRALAGPGWAELPFRAAHAGVALTGRIDRLWLDAEAGGFVVVDWKSDALGGRRAAGVAAEHRTQLRAYAWAADRVLAARDQPRVVRSDVVLTEVGAVVPVGGAAAEHAEEVLALLELAADTAAADWATVERRATDGRVARPCGGCGFFGRGCRGMPESSGGVQ